MNYTGQVYRPPTEAYTPLLEVTIGCSYNKCSFCTMYRDTPFRMAPEENIVADLQELSQYKESIERIYLLNGNPFTLSADKLLKIASMIHQYLPKVKTITCYCSIRDLMSKSDEDLKALHDAGYDELYIGIETAYAPALKMINKGCTVEDEYEQLHRIHDAGINYIGIAMLGIAGKGKSQEHITETAKLFNEIKPVMVALMSTSVAPGSELEKIRDAGEYVELTEGEILEEEILFLKELSMDPDCYLLGGHTFNVAPINGYFKDKEQWIKRLEDTLNSMSDSLKNSVVNRGHI